MLGMSLAVLLFGTWVNLSGVELVEDSELPRQVSLDSAGKESPAQTDGANCRLESAKLAAIFHVAVAELYNGPAQLDHSPVATKAGKIYRFLHVFLI